MLEKQQLLTLNKCCYQILVPLMIALTKKSVKDSLAHKFSLRKKHLYWLNFSLPDSCCLMPGTGKGGVSLLLPLISCWMSEGLSHNLDGQEDALLLLPEALPAWKLQKEGEGLSNTPFLLLSRAVFWDLRLLPSPTWTLSFASYVLYLIIGKGLLLVFFLGGGG